MKKVVSAGALGDRHRSPSANEICSSARVYLQSSKTDTVLSPLDGGGESFNSSPDKSEFSNKRQSAAVSNEDTKQEIIGAKHVKELPPTRMRSKSAISENEVPCNDGVNCLNPVTFERSKTITGDVTEAAVSAPPLSLSPHELVVPLNHCSSRCSPGPKEMASIKKKLFTSSSQDASSSTLFGSSTAPAAMLRANVPLRHNGGHTPTPSPSLSLTAPDGLSIITSSSQGLMLDGVIANEIRSSSEGGGERGHRDKVRGPQEKKSLKGVQRPPLSKDKIIKKSSRDNDIFLLELSGEDGVSASPPMVSTSCPRRRSSKTVRSVDPIPKRPVLDKKSLTKSEGPDFSDTHLPPKPQPLIPVRALSEMSLSGPALSSSSRDGSSDDVPTHSPGVEDGSDAFLSSVPSFGDNKSKLSVTNTDSSSDGNGDTFKLTDDKNLSKITPVPAAKAALMDCNLSYSESESGGALSASQGDRSLLQSPSRAAENDDILMLRMQEAQALNRKEDNSGAIMHKFSLWSNADPSRFRPLRTDLANDETVAPDKKPAKLRGPRAAIKHDCDAIHDDSNDGDHMTASTSTMVSKVSTTSKASKNALIPLGGGSKSDNTVRAHDVPVGAALGASGAMAMALRNMVGSAQNPSSPNVHSFDGEEYSYLNTCGSVGSLDEDDYVDLMSSIDETEMLSRATSVEVDEQDYQLRESEDDDHSERGVARETNYGTPSSLARLEGEIRCASSAEVDGHATPAKDSSKLGSGNAVHTQSSPDDVANSTTSSQCTERNVKDYVAGQTYVTPPRKKSPSRSDKADDNGNAQCSAFVHHSHPQPAVSTRRHKGDGDMGRNRKSVTVSLDHLKGRSEEGCNDKPKQAEAEPELIGARNLHVDIRHTVSDDKSVDFTMREKRRHHLHRMTQGNSQEVESRVESASSGIRPGKKSGGKQQIPWVRGEPIGQGTFGRVYRGMNEGTGELLAVKQISMVDGADDEVHLLRGEIRLMKSLDHANIVRYLGTSVSERYLFIILEYVPGGSIAGMLSQFGAFSEPLIR